MRRARVRTMARGTVPVLVVALSASLATGWPVPGPLDVAAGWLDGPPGVGARSGHRPDHRTRGSDAVAPAALLLVQAHDRSAAATRLAYRWELTVSPPASAGADDAGQQVHGQADGSRPPGGAAAASPGADDGVSGTPISHGGRVTVRDQGAFDRDGRRLWRAITLVRDGVLEPALRVVADDDRLLLQPGAAAEALGLAPGDWIGATGAIDPSAWSRVGLPPAAERLRELLLDAGTDPEVLGNETIDGASTTRLRISVRGASLRDLPLAGPIDVWIDADDHLRRLQASVTLAAAAPPAAADLASPRAGTIRLGLFDYGQPVIIDLPDQTAVVTQTAGLLRTVLAALGVP